MSKPEAIRALKDAQYREQCAAGEAAHPASPTRPQRSPRNMKMMTNLKAGARKAALTYPQCSMNCTI